MGPVSLSISAPEQLPTDPGVMLDDGVGQVVFPQQWSRRHLSVNDVVLLPLAAGLAELI